MKSPIETEQDLVKELKATGRAVVLFYASWCPFSKRFFPIFEKYAKEKDKGFLSFVINDDESIAEKYDIEVYPTVLFFENGKVSKRLDGLSGQGLNEKHLTDFISMCKV